MSLGVAFAAPEPVPAKVEPEGEREVSTFDFNGLSLRVVQIDGEPWFVAIDACRALGSYVKSCGGVNTTMALRNLNEDEIRSGSKRIGVTEKGGGGMPKLISESGLYKLITRSDKPEAKPFQEWVTRNEFHLYLIQRKAKRDYSGSLSAFFKAFVVTTSLALSPP